MMLFCHVQVFVFWGGGWKFKFKLIIKVMYLEMIVLLENIGRIGKRVASFGKGLLLNKY